MYGYVRPCKGELKVREYELFKARYCGLCHALKKRYRFAARFLVNYDFTFLSMLIQGPDECSQIERRRCAASPIRKKNCCAQSDSLFAAADGSVILGWWKLKDSAADKGFFKSLPYRAAALILKPAMKKASRLRPDYAREAESLLRELGEIESKKLASIDAPADCFARLLSALAGFAPEEAAEPLKQLLYHIGRWIYIVDALDDLGEDARSGSYNPLLLRFRVENGSLAENDKEYVSVTLKHSAAIAASAFELMTKNEWTSIISNIIYLGLPQTAEKVFDGTWRAAAEEK